VSDAPSTARPGRPDNGTAGDARRIADALIRARIDRTPIAPFTRRLPFLPVGTAYEAQALVVEHRLQAGEKVIGAKLGLTSRVKRQALGINEPVFGRLTSGMVIPHGEPVQLGELIHPRAEPELAFLIGERIEAPITVAGVLAATEAVFPAIEVMDSRYSESFRLPDSVADNAGAARIVVGARGLPPEALVDLSVLGCVFRCRGAIDTAAGGAVMGHPAAALVWLAEALATRGECIEAGSIVLSGGLTASVALQARGVAIAEFDGLGTIGVHCE
jgi:2-oxo-3-hexenedioate decarboxylase